MNRKQFVAEVKAFAKAWQLQPDEFYVMSGGALLMYRLRQETRDVDVVIPKDVYDRLDLSRHQNSLQDKVVNGLGRITGFNHSAEVGAIIDTLHFDTEMVDGIRVQKLESILTMKMAMNRPKDQEDIRVIRQYIALHRSGV